MTLNTSEIAAIRERLRAYSLSELEDVFAQVDRHAFPDRHALVAQEIEARLKDLGADAVDQDAPAEGETPGFWRRIGASFVDVSIQALVPYLVFFLIRSTFFPAQQAGPGRRGGGGTDIWEDLSGIVEGATAFITGLFAGDEKALGHLETYAPIVGVYLAYRTFWMVFSWLRTGATPGMRELGIRLERMDGARLSLWQAVGRFWLHHVLFVVTLGVSGFWMLWDGEGRSLHDRAMGTRLVRALRTWEKTAAARRFD